MSTSMLAADDVKRLGGALQSAGYTVDGVRDILGPVAAGALDRNETAPGRRATGGGSALELLTRLWPLQLAVPLAAIERVLPVGPLVASGILAASDDQVTALVDIRPYADDAGDWWVASDLTPGLDGRLAPVPDDHVLGVNAASSTLAQLTVREPAGRALDFGTGCGVQALHLARHCREIIGTDVNPRALALARLTAALNGLTVEFRRGSLFDPVADERFDLIVTNPPFVVSPGGHHAYRDSGLVGDEVSRRVVVDGASHLAAGGTLQSLANWMHVTGADWQERVGAWAEATGCDAWVIQREVQDPAAYVELWLRDSGDVARPDYLQRYDEWLSWFERQRVEGIGFGWVMLRAGGRAEPDIRIEDWPHAVEQPLGPAVSRHFATLDAATGPDDELLPRSLRIAPDMVQEQIGEPGAEDPEHIVLRQRRGLRRARTVGTAEAGFVGACDGRLAVGALVGALANVLAVDEVTLRDELLPEVRSLLVEGYLEP